MVLFGSAFVMFWVTAPRHTLTNPGNVRETDPLFQPKLRKAAEIGMFPVMSGNLNIFCQRKLRTFISFIAAKSSKIR